MKRNAITASSIALVLAIGCGGTTTFFNPAFLNTLTGEFFPLTPGPNAAFVMVSGLNRTDDIIDFIVTIDRNVLVTDDDGNFQLDDSGLFITRSERETVRLTTFPDGQASEVGVLFPCGESQITRVGLGENLLPGDSQIFVGGEGFAGAAGFGVSVDGVNPLSLAAGNFNCGDTIIYVAFTRIGVPGGVGIQTFLKPFSEEPSEFRGPNTFANLEAFLESQQREDDP